MKAKKIVIIGGTRPEVIKLAAIYHESCKLFSQTKFWWSGQHVSLAQGALDFFEITPDRTLKVFKKGQNSNLLTAKLLKSLDQGMEDDKPDVVIVQGDTTTALAGALAAFHRRIPVAHVEAGLRSGDLSAPFPEEMNRRVIDRFAKWCFPPTKIAKEALKQEGCRQLPAITGNTGIDALHWAVAKVRKENYWPKGIRRVPADGKLIISTSHRRENLGTSMTEMLQALADEVSEHADTYLIHAMHPNPEATKAAKIAFSNHRRIQLVKALDYPDFISLLDKASVVVSDSGGIQEESPSFRLPILITRELTERPEVLACGGQLIGQNPKKIKKYLKEALKKPPRKALGRLKATPFGDGKAARRIMATIAKNIC